MIVPENSWENGTEVVTALERGHMNQLTLDLQSADLSYRMGVHWNKESQKWRARIMVDGKRILIGYFSDLQAARTAYNDRAKELHGEFARHA